MGEVFYFNSGTNCFSCGRMSIWGLSETNNLVFAILYSEKPMAMMVIGLVFG